MKVGEERWVFADNLISALAEFNCDSECKGKSGKIFPVLSFCGEVKESDKTLPDGIRTYVDDFRISAWKVKMTTAFKKKFTDDSDNWKGKGVISIRPTSNKQFLELDVA